jgi:nucleoside-diphosphate-sugar epimerase
MPRVLITGAAGWLGLNLVRMLVRGMPECAALAEPMPAPAIRCLVAPGQDVSALREFSDRLEIVGGDVRDATACQRFCAGARGAVLIHTAGVIHPRRVSDFYQINVQGTKHLLAAASAVGVRRLVAVSSNSVCGCNPHPDHRFDEQSTPHPYRHYGRSKWLMEQMIESWRRQRGLDTVIIRCPWFYGPHQPARQTLFFRMIRDGRVPCVGSGDNLRSMAYVDNLCQGILLAARSEHASGRTYWIADREPYSMNQIVDTIENLLEAEFSQRCARRRIRLPGLIATIAGWADAALQALGLYHQKIHVLSEMNQTIACSIATARRELGYEPAIGLEEGMRRSLRWAALQGAL